MKKKAKYLTHSSYTAYMLKQMGYIELNKIY